MKLPDKAHEVFYDRGTIFYVPRKTKYEQPYKEIKVPEWLKQLFEEERLMGERQGRMQLQHELQDCLTGPKPPRLQPRCCHGRTITECDGTCTDNTPCKPQYGNER